MGIPLLDLAAPTLRRQHSLITRRQAVRLGNSEAAVRHLLHRGIWVPVDRGLYGPAGVPMTWRRSLMAAALLAPDGSLISHRAGAALRGVGGLVDPTPELSIPRGATFRRPWLTTHESTDLDLASPDLVDDIPTTGLRRLAVDLGGVVSFERYKHTVREMRHGHGVTSEELLRTYLRHKRRGRNGCGALRDWLDRYFDVSGTSESGIELVVLDEILDAGFPAPVAQHWVATADGSFRLDLAYPSHRIAIEIDGVQHEDRDVTVNDQRRTALLRSLGWTVIRIRARHLASDLPGALRHLREALDRPQPEIASSLV